MTTDTHEVLSALIDREPVDPDLLARVLEEPEARALLVDFVRLRALMLADKPSRLNAADGEARAGRTTPGSWMRTAAAFALVAGAAGGGFWMGERQSGERPPSPDRVVEFTPGVDWKPSDDRSREGI